MRHTGSIEHIGISFTSLDICAIIEACATYGVTSLTQGDLHLEFGKPTDPPRLEKANSGDPSTVAPPEKAPDHDQINADTFEDEVSHMREEQLLMATIENPGLAEQLLMDGDLEDDDDDTGSIDGDDE